MKAVIMAGGEGSRLRPLTSLRPKPMVPIMNQPVMEHIVGLVKHHGFTEVVATLAFMPQVIQDYFGAGDEWGIEISYALEETPLGTAGSVKNAQSLIGDETFVVISGDALTDIDLTEVIAFHKAKGGPATLALKRVSQPLDFGVVITDNDGRIERFLEKPSWGQVFSDTINTGIYVLEPEVFDHIPEGAPFDFSSELFPLLMELGHDLYGCVVDGYWCDVGSAESYMQVHRDILDGLSHSFIPGVHARESVWVGEGAQISPDSEIGEKVVLGRNVTIRSGARISEYSVLGDNCVVGANAVVTHSVIGADSFVGKQSTVSGALLCRHVDVRARASVSMGAVIGDEVMVGHGSHVGTDVQVYPYKRIEPGAVVNESLIWESTGARSLFGENGIAGLVAVDITPELGLKAAQAFGSLLPKGAHVLVSRDSSSAARMVKRAMVAGLNSAGCVVRDLRVASPALNRFTTRDTRCAGGVHVCQSPEDAQVLEIRFFDKAGIDIASWEEKKIERLYFRGEFRRAFFGEIGDILYPPRAMEYYAAGLSYALEQRSFDTRRLKVVADLSHGVASIVLPHVVTGWDVDLVSFSPFLDAERTSASVYHNGDLAVIHGALEMFQADFGVRFDPAGEHLTLVTASGGVLDGRTALLAMVDLWCRTDIKCLPIAVPTETTRAVERIASATGHTVIRPGRSRRALAALAYGNEIGFAGDLAGGYIFADFLAGYDAVMSLGFLARMIATDGRSLDEVVAGLPTVHTREETVFCPTQRKGAVMRAVTEAAAPFGPDLHEGVLIDVDGGWVLVIPHASKPVVTLWVEGESEEAALEIASTWRSVVESAIGND